MNAAHDPTSSVPFATSSLTLSPLVDTLLFSPSGVFYDDTLFTRWLVQLLNRLGVHADFSSFACLMQREALRAAYVGELDFWPAVRRLLGEIGLSRVQIAEVELAGQARARQCDEQIRLLPGVATTLSRLSASGVRMAIVANSVEAAWPMSQRLERLGLSDLFHDVIVSRDLGHVLPETTMFEATLERLGCSAPGVAFVSNCPLELHAAADHQLHAIALHCELERRDVRSIHRLAELTTAVTTRRSRSLAA